MLRNKWLVGLIVSIVLHLFPNVFAAECGSKDTDTYDSESHEVEARKLNGNEKMANVDCQAPNFGTDVSEQGVADIPKNIILEITEEDRPILTNDKYSTKTVKDCPKGRRYVTTAELFGQNVGGWRHRDDKKGLKAG